MKYGSEMRQNKVKIWVLPLNFTMFADLGIGVKSDTTD